MHNINTLQKAKDQKTSPYIKWTAETLEEFFFTSPDKSTVRNDWK